MPEADHYDTDITGLCLNNWNMTKFLLVDDHKEHLVVLQEIIQDVFPHSYVLNSPNGRIAVESAVKIAPDVILIATKDIKGIKTCHLLKQEQEIADIPIVIIDSCNADPKRRRQALDAGAEAFLSEPIDKTELHMVVKTMLKIKVSSKKENSESNSLSSMLSESRQQVEQHKITALRLLDNLNVENKSREKTQQLLTESEENYRDLFEANPHPMWIYDIETLRFLEVNDMAIHHYGFSREEFLKLTIDDIRPKEDIPVLVDSVKKAGLGLKDRGIWRHRIKNNRIIWVDITAHPIDWHGRKAIMVLTHDITERIMTEQDLKSALQQLEFHENNSPLAVIEFDNKFQITKWSENAKVIFGWDPEEVLGKRIDELRWVHEEDTQSVANDCDDMIALKKTSNCLTNRNYCKDGSVITCEWYNSVLTDSHGKLISVHSLVMNISEREKAEKSLLESNTFNRSLLQAIPFGMHIVDKTGEILFANEIMEQQIGTAAKGKKCWELYRDNKTRCLNCPVPSGIIIGSNSISESYNIFGGRVAQISHSGMLFNGQKAMLEVFQDITERKHIETELILAKEKAEEIDQLKTSFLANMSHEIRTPLNSIIGFSEMLTDPDYDPTQQFHIARMIYLSGNNLLSIINNILEISRIEAGQVEVKKKPFVVNKLIKEIEKEYLFKSIEKGLEFILDPFNPKEEVYLLSDEEKIKQILVNFISNAIKFTRRGNIIIRFQVINNFVEFSVTDTGIGISQEFHDKIFEHFRQVEAANTRKYGGNGLGLSISKGLVNLLGGDIWMQSEKGKGSTFFFSIPGYKIRTALGNLDQP